MASIGSKYTVSLEVDQNQMDHYRQHVNMKTHFQSGQFFRRIQIKLSIPGSLLKNMGR